MYGHRRCEFQVQERHSHISPINTDSADRESPPAETLYSPGGRGKLSPPGEDMWLLVVTIPATSDNRKEHLTVWLYSTWLIDQLSTFRLPIHSWNLGRFLPNLPRFEPSMAGLYLSVCSDWLEIIEYPLHLFCRGAKYTACYTDSS